MSRAGTADPTFPGRAKFGSKIARRNCEWHIARSGTEKLRPGELGDAYQPLLAHVKRSAQGPDEWADLERAVAQLPGVPTRFEKWLLPEPRPPRARAGDDAAPPQPRRRRAPLRGDHHRLPATPGRRLPHADGSLASLADPKPTGSSVRELAKQAALRIHAEKMLKQQRQLHRKLARAWQRGQPPFG